MGIDTSKRAAKLKWPFSLGSTIFLVAASLLCIILARSCLGGGEGGSRSSYSSAPNTYKVVYEVTGENPTKAGLTYENDSGNTEQRDVSLPWTYEFTAQRGQFLYISAQTKGTGGASTISCKITVNGVVTEKADSKGVAVIATCSGSAGQ